MEMFSFRSKLHERGFYRQYLHDFIKANVNQDKVKRLIKYPSMKLRLSFECYGQPGERKRSIYIKMVAKDNGYIYVSTTQKSSSNNTIQEVIRSKK